MIGNRKKKYYRDSICPHCNEECAVIALDTSVTVPGRMTETETIYLPGHGTPVSDCCEAEIENAEEDRPSWW